MVNNSTPDPDRRPRGGSDPGGAVWDIVSIADDGPGTAEKSCWLLPNERLDLLLKPELLQNASPTSGNNARCPIAGHAGGANPDSFLLPFFRRQSASLGSTKVRKSHFHYVLDRGASNPGALPVGSLGRVGLFDFVRIIQQPAAFGCCLLHGA